MATILDIPAQPRASAGTSAVNRLRKAGSIPAVIYGRKTAPTNVQVDAKSFTKLLESSASDNILVSLKLGDQAQLALVQEVQHDHLRGGILHVDFHAVAMDEEIHAQVPLHLTGESPGAKLGGLLEIFHHNLEVRCLPKDLPDSIAIDISTLEQGQGVNVGDIQLPAGVRAKLSADVLVLHCEAPKVEETPAAAAAAPAKK
jgi:large subunit ribosomal protein L25